MECISVFRGSTDSNCWREDQGLAAFKEQDGRARRGARRTNAPKGVIRLDNRARAQCWRSVTAFPPGKRSDAPAQIDQPPPHRDYSR